MSYQDNIIGATEKAMGDLFRSARATTADKLEWSPLGEGRTTLGILQECAQAPSWLTPLVADRKFPDITPGDMEKGREARQQWKTIDECEKVCQAGTAKLFAALRAVPESEFMTMVHLPFGGGFDMPLAAVMSMHFWNLTYHLGQVNYIQTLYGDKEMH
ncbi:MAG TPA: hypothetical protein VGM51_00330 [Armatimonadota bacterium]